MDDRTIALIALALSAGSFVLSWRTFRRAGARVDCSLDLGNDPASRWRGGASGSGTLVLRVRNKGMAGIQVTEVLVNVGRARRDAGRGVYTLGERIPPNPDDRPICVLPPLVDVTVDGHPPGFVVPGLHTETWTIDQGELFGRLAPALAICPQRVRAVLVLGDGRELTSNWVRLAHTPAGGREVSRGIRWIRR